MKEDLHRDYAPPCTSTSISATSEYSFGDLSKLTKDISDATKLAKKSHATTSVSSQQEILLEFPVQSGTSRQSAMPAIPAAKGDFFLSKGRPLRSN